MAQATKQAPTSNHQRLIVGLGLSINQAAAIYRAADESGKRKQVDDIAQACEHFAQNIKDAARSKLLAMIPEQPATVDASALLAALDLDGMPELPADAPVTTTTTTTKPARKPKPAQTSTATVAGERVFCTSQPPVNPSTKRRILWADSAQRSANGQTYINVGNGRRTIGATLEDWRAILIDHRDELLSTLESLHNEASQA